MPFDSKDTIIKSGYTPLIQWNKQGVTSPIETKNNIELFNFENKNNDGFVIEHTSKKESEPSKQTKTNTLPERIAKIEQELKKAENSNGLLGKAWSWFKNKTDGFLPVDSSNKVRKQLEIEKQKIKDIQQPEVFEELTGVEYSDENYTKFENGEIKLLSEQKLEGYKEGQYMAVDTVGDIVSGIAAFGIYTAGIASSWFTGGASIPLAIGAAAGVGAGVKALIKGIDTATSDKEFTLKDIGHDLITGAFSGALAPLTAGVGGAVGKTAGTRLGLTVLKSTTTAKYAVADTVLKRALMNPAGYEYLGGNMAKRALAIGTEMAVDGALGGALDGGFRAGLDSDGDGKSIAEGFIMGGAMGGILSPVIGGCFKSIGHFFGNKELTKIMKAWPEQVEELSQMTHNGQPRFNGDDITWQLAVMQRQDPDRLKMLADIEIDGKPRFTGIDIGHFSNSCRFDWDMDLITKLASMKDGDKWRFNGFEIDSIIGEAENCKIKPEILDRLIDFKVDGKYRFNGHDIKDLLYDNFYEKYSNLVDRLAQFKDGDKFILTGYGIFDLIRQCKGYEEETVKILEMTFNGKPRFKGDVETPQLAYALKHYPQETETLLNMRCNGKARFIDSDYYETGESPRAIAYLAQTYHKYPKETERIINLEYGGKPRFRSANDIDALIETYHKYPNEAEKLINLEYNGKPRFERATDINGLVEIYHTYPKETEFLLSLEYNGKPRFESATDIAKLVPLLHDKTQKVTELLEMKINGQHRFSSARGVADIIKFEEKSPEMYKRLLYEKVDNNYRFSEHDIDIMMDSYERNPEITKQMMNSCEDGKPLFCAQFILSYSFAYKNTPEIFEKLARMRKPNGKFVYDFAKESQYINTIAFKNYRNELNCLLDNKDFPAILIKEILDEFNSFQSNIIGYAKWFNRPIESMTKAEKRAFMSDLLANKNISKMSKELKKYFPAIPRTDKEYTDIMKRLAKSLNISLEKLPASKCTKFANELTNLSKTLADLDLSNLHTISLSIPHSEFITKAEQILSKLPKSEQYKLKEHFGFDIRDGKLTGYPDCVGKDLKFSDIISSGTKKAAKELEKIIKEYKNNNFITVKDYPEINKCLKEISKLMPEIYNQIDGSEIAVDMIKSMQKVIKNPNFKHLNESDKKVMILSTLLHNTDRTAGTSADSAFDSFFIAQKMGFSNEECSKVYSIIQSFDLIEKFLNAEQNKVISKFSRGVNLSTTERRNLFDRLAFNLREGNNFELAKMLYTSKKIEGLNKVVFERLEQRIRQIKANDFILPQTPSEMYLQLAQTQTLKGYNVNVVKASEIPDFYAFIHTPECSFASGKTVSRDVKFASLDAFDNIADEKIICTSYIANGRICGAAKHGFIFDVPNGKQYVGMGYDIFSISKNIDDMLTEYYFDTGRTTKRGYSANIHRTMISTQLKHILGISDNEYITRLDNIKSKLGKKRMTVENVSEIDSEFGRAYREFLSRDNTGGTRNKDALLRADGWNEVLVGTPKISAIFTSNLDELPEEYLIKAQAENIPIVII